MKNIKTYRDSLKESHSTFTRIDEQVMDTNMNINKLDNALMNAVLFRHPELARSLLSQGANANASDGAGQRTMHHAVENNDVEMMEMLMEFGADLETPDGVGQTPIHWSAFSDSPDATKFLLKHGVEPDPSTPKGSTPLNWAISYNSPDVAKELINAGVDPFSEGNFENLKEMMEFFEGDLSWWKGMTDDMRIKVARVTKTKNVFNV